MLVARGGVRHLVDAAVPVVAFLIGRQLLGTGAAIVVTLAAAAALAGWRLVRGDSPKVVAAALAAVALYSALVLVTGQGRNFFLPDLIGCLVLTLAFAATLLRGPPLSLWLCRRLHLEPSGTAEPRMHMHRRITMAWTLLWAVHLLVLVPLYFGDHVAVLGVASILLGKPSVVVMAAVTWLWMRRFPSGNGDEPSDPPEHGE